MSFHCLHLQQIFSIAYFAGSHATTGSIASVPAMRAKLTVPATSNV